MCPTWSQRHLALMSPQAGHVNFLFSRDAFYSSSSLPSKARLVEEFVSIQKGLCRSWRLSEGTRKRQVGHGKRYMARGSRHTRGWTTVTLVGRSTWTRWGPPNVCRTWNLLLMGDVLPTGEKGKHQKLSAIFKADYELASTVSLALFRTRREIRTLTYYIYTLTSGWWENMNV